MRFEFLLCLLLLLKLKLLLLLKCQLLLLLLVKSLLLKEAHIILLGLLCLRGMIRKSDKVEIVAKACVSWDV